MITNLDGVLKEAWKAVDNACGEVHKVMSRASRVTHAIDPTLDNLIDLPVTRACIEKWNAGRAKHGSTFEGEPLKELYAELIDAINYCDVATLQGLEVSHIQTMLFSLVLEVRKVHKKAMEGGNG